jgi:plastocyanin
MIKQAIGITGLAIVLVPIAFFPLILDSNYDGLKTLQVNDKIEIMILPRGFSSDNPHYVPQNVTARVGTLIEWTNGDRVQHTVTSDEGIQGRLAGQIFDSGPIAPRSEFILDTSRMLDDVYSYHCSIHPWAKGMLTLVTEPISIATDKTLYYVGEKVIVSGIAVIPSKSIEPSPTPKYLVNATAVKSVTLKISVGDEILASKEIPATNGGKYAYTFTVEKAGKYDVKASIEDFSASVSFEVAKIPRERIILTATELKDVNGKALSVAKIGQQVIVSTSIKNMLEVYQDYTYIVRINDDNDVTVLLTWKSDSVSPLALSKPSITWMPEDPDIYSIEIFVWSNMQKPEPLSLHVGKATLIVQK